MASDTILMRSRSHLSGAWPSRLRTSQGMSFEIVNLIKGISAKRGTKVSIRWCPGRVAVELENLGEATPTLFSWCI